MIWCRDGFFLSGAFCPGSFQTREWLTFRDRRIVPNTLQNRFAYRALVQGF